VDLTTFFLRAGRFFIRPSLTGVSAAQLDAQEVQAMENQTPANRNERFLSVVATVCYIFAMAAVFVFSYSLLGFALRIATQQTGILYSVPRY
jgi:hypothetical protein